MTNTKRGLKVVKKFVIVIVAVIVIVGGAVLVTMLGRKSPEKTNTGNVTANSSDFTTVSACDILTNSIANHVLGSSAVKETTPADGESTSDIDFSNCMYSTGPAVDPPHIVSAAVRSAKDSTGATSNKSVFTTAGRPSGVQVITGYGSSAYWDPSMGQLDILSGNNWYILSNYTGTAPTNGTATLAMAEQLAQALKLQ